MFSHQIYRNSYNYLECLHLKFASTSYLAISNLLIKGALKLRVETWRRLLVFASNSDWIFALFASPDLPELLLGFWFSDLALDWKRGWR